jgi:hypothetical protein
MAAIWTPDPSESLPSLSENDTNVTLTFGITDDGSSATPVVYTITDVNISPSSAATFFTTTISDSTANLFASSLAGTFPILNIRYRLNDVMYNINDWDDLPAEASHITEYSKDPNSPKDIIITINASGDDGSIETNSWTYSLVGDYSSGVPKFLYELSIRE